MSLRAPWGPACRGVAGLLLAASLSSCASLTTWVREQGPEPARFRVEERPDGYQVVVVPGQGPEDHALPAWLGWGVPLAEAWVGGNAVLAAVPWGHALDALAGGVLGGLGLVGLDLVGQQLIRAWRPQRAGDPLPSEAWVSGGFGWRARRLVPDASGRLVADLPLFAHEVTEDLAVWLVRDRQALAWQALTRQSPLPSRDPTQLPVLRMAWVPPAVRGLGWHLRQETRPWQLEVDPGARVSLALDVANVGPARSMDLEVVPDVLSAPGQSATTSVDLPTWLVLSPGRIESLDSAAEWRCPVEVTVPDDAVPGIYLLRLRAREVAGVASAPLGLTVRVRPPVLDRIQLAMPEVEVLPSGAGAEPEAASGPAGGQLEGRQRTLAFTMGLVAPEEVDVPDLTFKVRSVDPRVLVLDPSREALPATLRAGRTLAFRGHLVAAADVPPDEPLLLEVVLSVRQGERLDSRSEVVALPVPDLP
ncbi:MAG: hypothetical protein VKO21_01440 [Candidatus Sericytochromatia bacterium]|nr:hypothetical protein [Candidatus Sericytochromatia bacterium]